MSNFSTKSLWDFDIKTLKNMREDILTEANKTDVKTLRLQLVKQATEIRIVMQKKGWKDSGHF